jgi:hypothetical protein
MRYWASQRTKASLGSAFLGLLKGAVLAKGVNRTPPRRFIAPILSLCLCATLWNVTETAHAYEDQWTLGADIGAGLVLGNDSAPVAGIAVGVGASVGLSSAWTFRGRLSYDFHPATLPLHVMTVGAEVYYTLDILKFVPFFGVGLDGIGTVQEGALGADLAFHALVGVDWLVSRELVIGLDIRPYVLPFSLAERGIDPVYLSASLRVSLVFDRY